MSDWMDGDLGVVDATSFGFGDSDSAWKTFDKVLDTYLRKEEIDMRAQQPTAYGTRYPYTTAAGQTRYAQPVDNRQLLMLIGVGVVVYLLAKA